MALTCKEVEERADGKLFKDRDGIECRIRVEDYTDCWGIAVRKVWGIPTARGKRTKAYQETRRQLRDDWAHDLSASEPEAWSHAMMACGAYVPERDDAQFREG